MYISYSDGGDGNNDDSYDDCQSVKCSNIHRKN